jgi:hypothetical protein
VAQSLCFRKISLTPAQCIVGSLAFGDIADDCETADHLARVVD